MTTFETISVKIRTGQRITADEALLLFSSNDLLAIGKLAAQVNQRKNGCNVYFNVNRHDAGAQSPQSLTKKGIIRLIRKVGEIRVERDTLYHPIRSY